MKMMKCERCGGSGKYFQENPDCSNCPSKDECDDFGKQFCTVPSDCPNCLDTGTKPEPGQDERIRDDFEEVNPDVILNEHDKEYYSIEVRASFEHFKAGYTSRNAEIEAKDRTITDLQKLSSEHVSYLSELSKKETEIEALKAEIKSMRDFLELVERWKDAYPEDVFPPIGKDPYFMMCKVAGFSVDRVSAHVLRGIVKNYSDQASIFLNKSQTQPRNNPPNKSNN